MNIRREGAMAELQNGGTPEPLRPFRHSAVPADDPVIIAESPAMRRAVELARRFAATGIPVLLVGPTGTGKEVVAQAIHRWGRPERPLIDIDCGTLHTETAVNELFGHRRGSYTGAVESVAGLLEAADGGTLFLDELSSLPERAQAMLLRVLETGDVRRVGERQHRRVGFRLIAAIQSGGADASGLGRLRADLYHRLAGGIIHLPPLADRPEDMLPMAAYFAGLHSRTLAVGAGGVLEEYKWPGNVRELKHVLDRAVALQEMGALAGGTLRDAIHLGGTAAQCGGGGAESAAVLRRRAQLEEICRRHQGVALAIMAELGLGRATLYRRLEAAGVRLKDYRGPVGPPSSQSVLRIL